MVASEFMGYPQLFADECRKRGISFGVHFDGSLDYIMLFGNMESDDESTYQFNCAGGRIFLDSPESCVWLGECIRRKRALPEPKPGVIQHWEFDDPDEE